MIELIIFDLNETLIKKNKAIEKLREERFTQKALKKEGFELSWEEIKQGIKETNEKLKEHEDVEKHQLGFFPKKLGETLGIDLSDSRAKVMENKFQEACLKNTELYPHAKEILKVLRNRNKNIALVTNEVKEIAEEILIHFNIKKYFERVITTSEVGNHKHELNPFKEALGENETDPKKAIVVGNKRESDMQAKKLGIHTALFLPGAGHESRKTEVEPDFKLNSLWQLKELVNKLDQKY